MFLPDYYEFVCPIKTNSGLKSLETIPNELNAFNAKKPLVITKNDNKEKRALKAMTCAFKDSNLTFGIFDNVPFIPDFDLIKKIKDIFIKNNCDSIIAIGNGTVTNVAKVVNIAICNKSKSIKNLSGEDKIHKPLKPFIFIPSTISNGFDTSKYATIGDKLFSSSNLMPSVLIIDHRAIMLDVDIIKVIDSVLTAFTYSIEAFTSKTKNPLSDTYAAASIQLISENLISMISNFFNRKNMLAIANATCFSGCTLSKTSEGITPKIARVISKLFNQPEGICMGVLLPYCLDYYVNNPGYNTSQLLMPLSDFDVYSNTKKDKRGKKAIDLIKKMIQELNLTANCEIPKTLHEMNIPKYALPDISKKVMKTETENFNFDDCTKILEHAWYGTPLN